MPPNPAPGINPVALTYTPPPHPRSTSPAPAPSGSTAASIPHPEPISSKVYHIAGLLVTVYGLEELAPSCTDVAVLWLLHPRLQTQECMAPFAAHIIASFDQRNHGSREVSAIANEAWRGGNENHAQDMFGCFQGTAADTSQLIDYLPGYIFPAGGPHSDQRITGPHIALGVSLGGHSAWQCVLHDPRISAAIVTIGCPDYERLMTDRARLSKRKSWLDGNGARFVGSADFPASLAANPVMARHFANKRILCLSGGADRLVPYKLAEPFMTWLKAVSAKGSGGGFFQHGGLFLHDVVLPGVGHDVPPQMRSRI
ncbi:hypothetical protein DV735_g4151, partial [Chaetothyriales sp. CBS 134920]